MKPLHVLFVTYVFPPVGGVGVLRAASLARYFPAEGIRLHVLTARNPSAVGADASLLAEIPPEVSIHRTTTLDLPFGIKKRLKKIIAGGGLRSGQPVSKNAPAKPGFLKRLLQDLLLPDPQVTWLPILTHAARRIIKQESIDLVLITAPPFSNVLLVERLRRDFPSLAIVVDFRDEWLSSTIDLVSFSSSKRALRFAQAAEAKAVAAATAIVAVTEAARIEIRSRYPHQPESKFQLIPNGFDATRVHPITPSSRIGSHDSIVVTYLGSIYGSTEPITLVQALQSLPPEIRSRFRFRFIGHIEEARYREALLGLGDIVELKGFLPQSEALSAMNQTDYALLISHDHLNVSAKFYDYIGACKPILATVHPDGDVRRMLEQLGGGWWAGSRDVEGIRQLFLDAAARGGALQAQFKPNLEAIAGYERKVLASRYAGLLHSIAKWQVGAGLMGHESKATGKVH